MKILYDYIIFSWQKFGGISRYFYELMNHGKGLFEYDVSGIYSENEYVTSSNLYKKFPLKFNFKGKKRIINLLNRSNSIKKIKKGNYDIIHPTYYDLYFLSYLKNKPFVLTVYDMIHELFQEYFLEDKWTVANKRKLILEANRIIAISENTKKDIIRQYPEVKNKISVIYLGFSFHQINEDIPKENYILFTGVRSLYKNFNTFLQAIAPLLKKYDLNLVCTGQPFNYDEIELINNLHVKDRTSCIFVSENQLLELYSKATAFVFPSLYEGFGIPVLEAFASNCPAILSNTSSLPEIGGDAAVYFDPYNIEDMRNQIELVITSPELQKEMIKKGKERVKQFSWQKCAKETMEVYKSLQG